MSPQNKKMEFPKDFLWGTATSAHQIEGDNFNSDWWQWEQQNAGKVLPVLEKKYQDQKFEPSGKASDHFNKYVEDFDLLEDLNNNAYRMSIEWARIEPEKGKFDFEALEHYKKVLLVLKQKNIKIMLTLHHFTNPLWFANKGGWENLKAPFYFSRYVKFVVEHLGNLVDFWITINEPTLWADMSYRQGFWPPQKKSLKKFGLVMLNMVRAHKKAYKVIHSKLDHGDQKAKVGIAQNVMSFATYKKHYIIELVYVYIFDRAVNHSFYDFTKKHHDFLGMNYYFRVRIKRKENSWAPEIEEIKETERELSDMGWMIYPHGIFDVLMDFKDFNLPIYITENGIAAEDDKKREKFLVDYLRELHHAIQAGVDVKGYFHWSLLDNFEWDKSFGPKFGLVNIDLETLKRTPKPSFKLYSEICKTNGVTPEMISKVH